MSWFQGLFLPKQSTHEPPDSLKIYTDIDLKNHVRLQITRGSTAQDIIMTMFSESNYSLVLVTEQKENVRICRRLLGFEKILHQIENKPSNVLYHYLINDFTIRRHFSTRKKIPDPQTLYGMMLSNKIEDTKFEQVGRVEKKNKKGKYVESRGYLNALHFGFLNMNKNKMKLFKLENIQLYVWDDDCEFSFKIVTTKKIYFFRSYRESDFKLWLHHLERRLECTRYKLMLLNMEKQILDDHRNLQDLVEHLVQMKVFVSPRDHQDIHYQQEFNTFVLANCVSQTDINFLNWAMLASKFNIFLDDIEVLAYAWKQIVQDYHDESHEERFPEQSHELKRTLTLRNLIEFQDFSELVQIVIEWQMDKYIIKEVLQGICEQIYQILYKKYYSQFLMVKSRKGLIQTPKINHKNKFYETPNFQYFRNLQY